MYCKRNEVERFNKQEESEKEGVMSHNINEGRIFYVGEKPWHGIGTELAEPATSAEAIQAAQLDYEVETKPIQVAEKNGPFITDKFATVRKDTGDPLGIVGKSYRIIQNVDAFNFFDDVVGDGKAIYHTAGALGLGERIWILAKLPDVMQVAKDDVVDKYLCLTNSHDGTSALKMYFTPIRVVCQNTLSASLMHASDGISIRHIGNVQSKVAEAQRALGLAVTFYAELAEVSKIFVNRKLKVNEADNYFKSILFGKRDEEQVSSTLKNQRNDLLTLFERGKGNDLPEVRHSVWAAYNAVTEYVDHHKTVRGSKEDSTKRLSNIWFGGGARLKEKAFNRALDVAGVKPKQ